MVSGFARSYWIHAVSGLPSLIHSDNSLSSRVFFALSFSDPAVTLTTSSVRRIVLYDSPSGVGPRLRFTARPSDGKLSDRPSNTLTVFDSSATEAGFRPFATALKRILPDFVVERINTRFTPPSTGKLFARIKLSVP